MYHHLKEIDWCPTSGVGMGGAVPSQCSQRRGQAPPQIKP